MFGGSRSIIDCNSSPIIVDISEWLCSFIGRYSIGKRINMTEAAIYAYSDEEKDVPFLGKYALEHNMMTIRSVSMKGVTTVEKC